MTTEPILTGAYIPDLPRDMSVRKDGLLNFEMQLSLSTLYQALQGLVSNEGLQLPPLNATQRANIQTFYQSFIGKILPQNVPNIAGRMAYDTSVNNPIVFIMTFDPATLHVLSAVWKTFTIV